VILWAALADAGIAYRDDGGRVADFHALRHTFITNLVRGRVHPKLAQALARHSTPTLTLAVYTKLGVRDLSDALSALPPLAGDAPERERLRATGTDDVKPLPARQQFPRQLPRQLGRGTVRNQATPCDADALSPSMASAENPLFSADSDDVTRHHAASNDEATGRTRTDDLRFTKPLLCRLSYGGKSILESMLQAIPAAI